MNTALTLIDVLSLDDCHGVQESSSYRFPCCLEISQKDAEVTLGVVWSIFQKAHKIHHELGHANQPWMLIETVTTKDATVTIKASCSCVG